MLRQITQGARTATIDYDAQFRPEVLTDALNRQVRFTYDLNGRITTQTLPDQRVIRFDYDDNGNLTSLTPPTRPAHTFTYTPVDLAGAYTPPVVPGTGATTYRYNRDRQIVGIDRPDGQTTGFVYDSAGRLFTLVMGGEGATTYGYDSAGRVATVTTAAGQGLTYTYDGPLVTSEQWTIGATGTVSRTFGADLLMTSETVAGTPAVTFTYDGAGLVSRAGASVIVSRTDLGAPQEVQVGGSGGVTETIAYTPLAGSPPGSYGEPSIRESRFSFTGPFFTQTYRRDLLGRIETLSEDVNGQTATFTYGYDAAGRLERVDRDALLLARYRYDGNGNRVETTTPQGVTSATFDDQDRLSTFGAATFTSTANGERRTKTTAGETTTYTYDMLGNLTRVQLPDGRDIRYVVDGRGRRVRKLVNGVPVQGWLWLDQLRVAAELDGNGAVRMRFVYGSRPNVPDYVVTGGQTLKVVADHLGSPRLLVNVSTGAIAQQLAYDAYGAVILDTAPGFQPLGFAGGLYDKDTGLVRFGARDYDPATGTWTAKDPIGFAGNNANLYGYVLGDPINYFDPTGLVSVPFAGWFDVGESAGQQALDYWASKIDDSSASTLEQLSGWVGGFFAALWTPCSSDATLQALFGARAIGSYLGRPFWQYYPAGSQGYASKWLTRGWGYRPPYATGSEAASKLSLPPYNPGTAVRPVTPSPFTYVGGPGTVSPAYGQAGGGTQYLVGGWPR